MKENSNPPHQPAHMKPIEAAMYVGISASKLAKLRLRANRACGPAFVKLAGCVLYRRQDLDAWIEANLVNPQLS